MSDIPQLLDDVHRKMRAKSYSRDTKKVYYGFIVRFLEFHRIQEREALMTIAEEKVDIYLDHLALVSRISINRQNQARSALVFLYKHVLERPFSKKSL
ncbi:MAG: site-specific integrase [Methylococcaceae bacterium]